MPAARDTTPKLPPPPPMPWDDKPVLEPGETFALAGGSARRDTIANATAAGLLDVDLSDEWAPFIFSESDGPGSEPKPHFYRKTYVDLASDRIHPDDLLLEGGATKQLESPEEKAERKAREADYRRRGKEPPPPKRPKRDGPTQNFLEVYGIPPTLSVLWKRIETDRARTCYDAVDVEALRAWDGEVTYHDRDQARREFNEANGDAAWIAQKTRELYTSDAGLPAPEGGWLTADAGVPPPESAIAELAARAQAAEDKKTLARIERWRKGQKRLRAVRAAQARLACEGLLLPKRSVDGMFDLFTHQALAEFEKKNDIFGWGFLAEETTVALTRPPLELHFETFKRIVTERIVDAAAIIEDGSVSGGKRPATYKTETGESVVVPNLVEQHLNALLEALAIRGPDHMVHFLEALGDGGRAKVHVAFAPPPLPPYYPPRGPVALNDAGAPATPEMDLVVEIDRGDVWYDFPFDANGKPLTQRREKYPNLVLFVKWNKQKIPLARWRTTIGSWRSELHTDGKVYFKYKNSDVGPRIWRDIVSAPVWVPPDSTPTKDLLTKRTFDRNEGPRIVVDTEVMGPGFQSAYGLVLAIHHEVKRGGGLFDNQIRTHGSVDYTSIARRFSHGCHRLVNNRAVRLFGFVLRHKQYERVGNQVLAMKKKILHEEKEYGFEMTTRGYLYRLRKPVQVEVLEGRVMGQVKKPIVEYVRKPGVDYGPEVPEEGAEGAVPGAGAAASPVETAPVVGP